MTKKPQVIMLLQTSNESQSTDKSKCFVIIVSNPKSAAEITTNKIHFLTRECLDFFSETRIAPDTRKTIPTNCALETVSPNKNTAKNNTKKGIMLKAVITREASPSCTALK